MKLIKRKEGTELRDVCGRGFAGKAASSSRPFGSMEELSESR